MTKTIAIFLQSTCGWCEPKYTKHKDKNIRNTFSNKFESKSKILRRQNKMPREEIKSMLNAVVGRLGNSKLFMNLNIQQEREHRYPEP